MKKTLISGAVAALLSVPAMAQNADSGVEELRQQVERLSAEVDYLKENAKAQRKEAATEAVDFAAVKTTVNKFTWSGDFRYRSEHITTAASSLVDEQTRHRDRIRARFGVSVKVNDTITGKLQLATNGGSAAAPGNDPRSTNQTLGEGWTRKGIAIDQAYVDWKALSFLNVQLGKTPMPWTRTASYFWDGDITSEGAVAKFSKGALFGNVSYDWLNERHSSSATGARSDSKLIAAQVGLKQPIGNTTLTAAVGYFDVTNVKNEIVTGTGCTANSTFFGGSSNGNTTTTLAGCTVLASDFTTLNALAQLDFSIGKFPMSVFVDYMQNQDAEVNSVAGKKLDTAYAAGVTFNKASAAKSWEVAVVYQRSEKDAIFGQFHDSDFGDGKTDTDGTVLKVAYVPATNWTLNGTYIMSKLNNDAGTDTTTDLDYKRLQLDLNYKF